jgi:hypothetical protein
LEVDFALAMGVAAPPHLRRIDFESLNHLCR